MRHESLYLTDIVEATDHIVQSGRTLADTPSTCVEDEQFWALRQAVEDKVSNVVRSCSEGRAWGVPPGPLGGRAAHR